MLPIVSINPYPVQPALVATAMPDSTTLRVPYDNVAPSVSSAHVDTDASGNSGAIPTPVETPAVETPAQTAASAPLVSSANEGGGTQAAFLAQLISQEVPPSLQETFKGVLAKYETLVVDGFTKYKPSDATLPPPQPSGVFGRLVQEQNSQPAQTAPAPAPTPAPSAPSVQAGAVQSEVAVASAPIILPTKPAPLPVRNTSSAALSAYSATVSRNASAESVAASELA